MARALDSAIVTICCSIAAVLLVGSLGGQLPGSATSTTTAYTDQAPTLQQVFVPLPLAEAATAAFFTAAGHVFRHLRHAGGNRRHSEAAIFTMCASVGVLQHVVFVQPPAAGVAINVNIGLAAARALPAAAAAAFFLGMALVVAQVRAGGGGRGGAVAVQGAVWILSNVALGAAAVVVALMAMAALYTNAY